MAFKDNSVSARSVAPTNVTTAKQSRAYNKSMYITSLKMQIKSGIQKKR
jgi:hypothetical protein